MIGLLDGVRELGPLATDGLTPNLLPQKGQGMRSLLIHLPGGVDYRTTIQTFTVSMGSVRHRKAAAPVLGTHPASRPPTHHSPHLYAQVAAEVVEELCRQMGITDPQEMQEFALFLIKKEGESLAWGGSGARLDSKRWLICWLCGHE